MFNRLQNLTFRYYDFIAVTVINISAIILRLNNFSAPIYDAYYFRQTQTATVARNFYEKGINLLRPELDIFGIGKEQYLILESPLYQAVYAAFAHILGFSDTLGRAISIASRIVSGLLLYLLVLLLSKKKKLAFLSMTIFYFFPLAIFSRRTVLIESFVLMLHLLALVLWILWLRHQGIGFYLLVLLITILAIISKIIYGPFLLLFIAVLLVVEKGKRELIRVEMMFFSESWFWRFLVGRHWQISSILYPVTDFLLRKTPSTGSGMSGIFPRD